MHFTVRPFQFGEIFGNASMPDDTDVEGLRLRIAALDADLALLRQSGEATAAAARAEGFAEGLARAGEDQSAALLTAVDALHAALEEAEARFAGVEDEAVAVAGQLAIAAAGHLAAQGLAVSPVGAIDAAIGRALRQVARGQEVQVVVHPGLVPAVEEVIAARQASDRRRLNLWAVGDPALGPGDAHIRWDQGGAILDAAAREAAVRDAMTEALASAAITVTPVAEDATTWRTPR